MKIKLLVLPAGALAAASILLAPTEVIGFSTLGHSLGQNQRDFRVHNNFSDSTANNNTTPDPDWPGYTGAELAIWKACVEWSSEPHGGTGAGDPTQASVGGSDANFDPSWQGNAVAIGGSNDNIHSEINGSSGGTLAFAESSAGGWRIRYYSNWTWHDGPGTIPFSGYDLQSVACHEYGHALGLGHSTSGGATMWPSTGNGSESGRSINADDAAGVQSIYGVVDTAVKPSIDSISVSGGLLTITGTNFADTDNEVWFTAGSGNGGDPIVSTGLDAVGNTTITTGMPAGANTGDILVKKGGNSTFSGLSNPWPFDFSTITLPAATTINIDLGTAKGTPGTGQGGVPGNTGVWNAFDLPAGTEGLIDLTNFQTAGTFSHDGTAGEFVANLGAATGFYEKLFEDGHDVGCIGTPFVTYTFDGFAAGTYSVYVYSWALENAANSLTDIEVLGGSKGLQTCGGIAFSPTLVDGGNYVVDTVTISAGGTIQVTAARNSQCARINGFQITPGTACGVSTNYCTPGTSSGGCQATMSSTGTPSATAASGFTVTASTVEGLKDGLFFYGSNGQQANSWGSSSSFQCIVPPVIRAGLLPSSGTSGACDGSFSQDLNALWTSNPAKNPGAGADVNVQLWYRDPANTSNQTTALSDGLNFTVCP